MVDNNNLVDYSLQNLQPVDFTVQQDAIPTSGTTGGNLPTVGPLPTSNDPLDFVANLVNAVIQLPNAIEGIVSWATELHPISVIQTLGKYASHAKVAIDATDWIIDTVEQPVGGATAPLTWETTPKKLWAWLSKFGGGFLYRAMLEAGLGVDVDKFPDEAKGGVHTVDTLVSFAMVLQFGVALLEHIGKPLLANRWPDALAETIAKIPEEMGLSWAMGIQIDEGFKTAVGRSVEEAINRQKRGNRIDWPILRTMLRQNLFNDLTYNSSKGKIERGGGGTDESGLAVLRELLINQGFPDEYIDLIVHLADAQLTLGDIQQMYLSGIMDDQEVQDYIKRIGYDDTDRKRLYTHYIDKADTQAAAVYRSTMRSLFRDNIIDEKTYRDALAETNFPKLEIEYDVRAITEEHRLGHLTATTTLIKTRYLHNEETPDTAKNKLIQNGYQPDVAAQLVASWTLPPVPKARGLTVSQVLSYEVAGILTPNDAYARLLSLGVNPNDAEFLKDNPTSHTGTSLHKRTPALVISAYVAGAIDDSDLKAAFTSTGVAPDDLDWWIAKARWQFAHRTVKGTGETPLNKTEIIDLFKLGIWTEDTAHSALMSLNYSTTNASLLLEIANKGPITAPPPPVFQDVSEAVAYLQSEGFTFTAPDQKTIAAEAMVESAGLTPVPPTGYNLFQPAYPGAGTTVAGPPAPLEPPPPPAV